MDDTDIFKSFGVDQLAELSKTVARYVTTL